MIKKTTIRKLLYYTRFHVLLSGRKKRLKNSAQSLYHSSKFRNSIVRCILCVIYHFDIAIHYVFAILALCLVAIIVKSQSLNRERIWVTIDQRDTTRYSLWPFLLPRERKQTEGRRVE